MNALAAFAVLVLLARYVASFILAILAALLVILAVLLDHEAHVASAACFFIAGALAYLAFLLHRKPRAQERGGS